MKALWNGYVLAESDDVEELEGNYYFPLESINRRYFVESNTLSLCPVKGKAHYYHILVNGKLNEDAACYYPSPRKAPARLKNMIAFNKGVEMKESSPSSINFDLLKTLNIFF